MWIHTVLLLEPKMQNIYSILEILTSLHYVSCCNDKVLTWRSEDKFSNIM